MASKRGQDEFGDLNKGTLRGTSFKVARAVLLGLCRVLIGMRVKGIENVPREGGLLVVSNHLHNADPLLISIATPRPVHFMAKIELMRAPVLGWLISLGGAFPVDRGKSDRVAIRRAMATVDQGIAVGIFPEGTRSRSRHIERVLPGAGLIALQAGAPITPVAVTGTEHLPMNGKRPAHSDKRSWWIPFKRKVLIEFGKPITLPRELDGKRLNSEGATNLMMQAIAEMLPEHYRGIYSSSSSEETSTPSSSNSISSS